MVSLGTPCAAACDLEGGSLAHTLVIVAGTGAGQIRQIVTYAPPPGFTAAQAAAQGVPSDTIQVDRPWDVVPDATSRYVVVGGNTHTILLKDNSFYQAGAVIEVLYCGGRDVAVVGNHSADSGPLLIRSFQNLAHHRFNTALDVLLADNFLESTPSDPYYASYADCGALSDAACDAARHVQTPTGVINQVGLISGEANWGVVALGVEMRSNVLFASPLLLESSGAYNQGFLDSVNGGPALGVPDAGPAAVSGTVLDSNLAYYYVANFPGFGVDLQFDATTRNVAPAQSRDDFAYWTSGDPNYALWNPRGSDSVNAACGRLPVGAIVQTPVPVPQQARQMSPQAQCALFNPKNL